nr:MAG TPA: hypothetical protein [Bacteriophage sp.]
MISSDIIVLQRLRRHSIVSFYVRRRNSTAFIVIGTVWTKRKPRRIRGGL